MVDILVLLETQTLPLGQQLKDIISLKILIDLMILDTGQKELLEIHPIILMSIGMVVQLVHMFVIITSLVIEALVVYLQAWETFSLSHF